MNKPDAKNLKKPCKLKRYFLRATLAILLIAVVAVVVLYLVSRHQHWSEKSRLAHIQNHHEKLNVILISIDTTRADHLGCYGYQEIETPYIDRLAHDGTMFLKCDSHVPLTLPSHISMLTGNYPTKTQVHDNNQILSPSALTLGEILQANGYHTGAFVGSVILKSIYGLNQGFDYYGDQFESRKQTFLGLPEDRLAREVLTEAHDWIKDNEDSPFFAFIHLYDPHASYQPPEPYKSEYQKNPYDGEIAYVDASLGIFFEFLKQVGLWDNSLIILTADHGEAFGEHNEHSHCVFIYETTLHVPLIIHCPGLIPAEQEVTEQVRLVDIMPTILDILGIEIPADISGASLLPYIYGSGLNEPTHYSYCESYHINNVFGYAKLVGIQDNQWKYIKAPTSELYNLQNDGDENNNLYFEDLEQNQNYDRLLSCSLEESLGNSYGNAEGATTAEVDEEQKAALYSLGYIGAPSVFSPEQKKERAMIDPKDRTTLICDYQQLLIYRDNGLLELSDQLLREMLKMDAEVPLINLIMGENLFDLGDYENAYRWFQRTLELDPANTMCRNYMGLCRVKEERYEEAERVFQEIIGSPDSSADSLIDAYLNLGTLYNNIKNQPEQAIYYLNKVLEIDPDNLRAHNYLTLLYFSQQRDLEKARYHAEQYLKHYGVREDRNYSEISKIYQKLKMLDD
jgi:choline-sulfatase